MSVEAAELEVRSRDGVPLEGDDPFVHEEALARLDQAAVALCRAAAAFLEEIAAAAGKVRPWEVGCQDLAHLVAARYGFAAWKAHRAVEAARALRDLPRIRGALSRGELSFDKVLELCRFAKPGDEEGLVAWARGASVG
ncbi:MAG TPA: DUF222 domain-containing protein, partial [Actinomycetota bacterium]|nr:DUF222 domain-containing protein [Actinomycetota bacterium]